MTSLEVGEHLKACSDCSRLFSVEVKLEAKLRAGLNRGPRSAALWGQIEKSLAVAASAAPDPRSRVHRSQPVGWTGVREALAAQLRAGWQASRWAWSGLAAVWVVILMVHLSAREPDALPAAWQEEPSAYEMRFALKQKQLLMAELASTPEPAPVNKPKPPVSSPRSDRYIETFNT